LTSRANDGPQESLIQEQKKHHVTSKNERAEAQAAGGQPTYRHTRPNKQKQLQQRKSREQELPRKSWEDCRTQTGAVRMGWRRAAS
jgi:hypothetical protein